MLIKNSSTRPRSREEVRDKNVRDGGADNAIFKRKVYFKKSVPKIAKFRNFENSKSHS